MDVTPFSGHSDNPQAGLLAKLLAEMPEIFSEGKIDSQKLRATLGEEVFTDNERYGLTWNGKADCFKKIQETTTNTLRPCREESVDFDATENVFIEGDNLQALKVLQKSYYGRVKMIYIDPPYNTGSDFIYNDKFSRTKKEELFANGSIDEHGNIINHDLYRQNSRENGHFHSNWLTMIYPRLFLARNLLRQDGVLFVSIDHNEVGALRLLLDEVFGENNCIEQLIWKNGRTAASHFTREHEYILCYARNIEQLSFFEYSGDDIISDRTVKKPGAKNPVSDIFFPAGIEFEGEDRVFPNRFGDAEPITVKTGVFECKNGKLATDVMLEAAWAMKDMIEGWIDGESVIDQKGQIVTRFFFKSNGVLQYEKEKGVVHPKSIITGITTKQGSKALRDLLGASYVEYPKPPLLIKNLVEHVTKGDDIVVDFFAGTGTTAQAVMQLNAEKGGRRKWICVQLPEKCKEESEAAKAGFVTIADIAKERIRRAGKKLHDEHEGKELDAGFKVFKLEESNFKVWNTRIESVEQLEQQLLDFVDNARQEARTEDLLYELILKSGLELNVLIEEKAAKGGKYHRIGDGRLIICLADTLTQPLLQAILRDKPEKIIVLDRAFADNDQLKTNMLLEAEQAGVKEFNVI